MPSIAELIAGRDEIAYAKGFDLDAEEPDESLQAEAAALAKESDVTVIFAGLPNRYESEGADRKHMRIPENQNALISAVAEVSDKVAVVLFNGSPVEMPWKDDVEAILEMYLGGDGVSEAAMALLYGEANPSGKLAETFPVKLADNPSYLNFPGEAGVAEYHEGIYVGYRYYDKKEMEVLFPFGHGLSYTTFAYSDLKISAEKITDQEKLTVSVHGNQHRGPGRKRGGTALCGKHEQQRPPSGKGAEALREGGAEPGGEPGSDLHAERPRFCLLRGKDPRLLCGERRICDLCGKLLQRYPL